MIDVTVFGKRIPRISAKLLESNLAQVATNCDLQSGNLKPIKDLSLIQTVAQAGDIRTVHKLNTAWLAWDSDVDVVKAQVQDSDYRSYFTGDGYPKQTNLTLATSGAASTYPTETRRLGVVPPDAALTVEPQGTGSGELGVTYSYIYTYVTAWGEESAPSPVTGVSTLEEDQHIRLKGFVKPTLVSNGNDITHFRLYRLLTGTSGTAAYQLVKARPVNLSGTPVWDIPATLVTSDEIYVYDADDDSSPTALTSDLGEVCPTESWVVPPSDMAGLIQFQNGILAGFSGQEVCVSEPHIPYAWPEAYRHTVDYEIVALGVHGSTLVVATDAYPYIIQGSDPSTMTKKRIEVKQKCLSKRGLVSSPYGVFYPSPEGLYQVTSAGQAVNATEAIFTAKQWRALSPETLIGFFYDDSYYGFFQGTNTGIVIDMADTPSLIDVTGGDPIYCGFIHPDQNDLYVVDKSGTTYSIRKWEGGTGYKDFTWKSKVFEDRNLYSCGRVHGDFTNGNLTLKVYLNGSLVHTATISDEKMFRLPAGSRPNDWEFQLEGKPQVDRLLIAASPVELSHV